MKKLLSVFLLLTFVVVLTACSDTNELKFELIGDEISHHTINTPYSEKGFIARDDNGDLSEHVEMVGNINPTEGGNYTVTYTLTYGEETHELVRQVYYRDAGCRAVVETNLTECSVQWSQYLDTYVSLTFTYEDDVYHGNVIHLFNHVESILADYHKWSNKYDAFDNVVNIRTINDDPTTTHSIDEELLDLIKFSLEHQGDVDNLFNIALGPVLKLWHDSREDCSDFNAATPCTLPLLADLQAANAYTDHTKIVLDEENKTITMEENMSLDLGGVSKGYISGKIMEYLNYLDLYGYLLNNGTSNISIGGTHKLRENGKYKLALQDPTGEKEYYALVFLGDGDQLVTSGDYQKFFLYDDEMYHHIINPVSLMPDRNSRSVSIITSDPALADLYSTAIFVMTIEDGIDFVNSIDGLEGIWYGLDGTIHFSENFEEEYLDELN